MVVSVQFPADSRPHPRHNWHWLLAVTAEEMSAEWAGAARGSFLPHERGTELGNAMKLPKLMKLNFFLSCSKHYPSYSLNVASMWLKLGRLYMALKNRTAGVKALKRVFIVWFLH